MFETKVMVAPNSPRLRANESRTPVMTPGSASGSVMVRKTPTRPAPSVLAAASSLRSIVSNDSLIARTISGNPMMPAASAAPVQRKATTIPNHCSRISPSGPRRPKRSSRKNPTTTGGSTSGRCTTASNRAFPGKLARARKYATATAKGRLTSTLQNATRRLSHRTSSSSGAKPMESGKRALETVLLEDRARLGPVQPGQESRSASLGGSRQGDRIDDWRVGVLGKESYHANLRVHRGVGAVDDAQWRFAP